MLTAPSRMPNLGRQASLGRLCRAATQFTDELQEDTTESSTSRAEQRLQRLRDATSSALSPRFFIAARHQRPSSSLLRSLGTRIRPAPSPRPQPQNLGKAGSLDGPRLLALGAGPDVSPQNCVELLCLFSSPGDAKQRSTPGRTSEVRAPVSWLAPRRSWQVQLADL